MAALTAQGCSSSRAATAYVARADHSEPVAGPSDGHAPIPCLSLTGQGTSEATVGISADGTVFFAPASSADGNGVARSKDQGATWEVLIPKIEGSGHTRLEPYLWVDPVSSAVYFTTSKLVLDGLTNFMEQAGLHLSVSSDLGQTWTSQDIAPKSHDWAKIFSGKPVSSQTSNIVYYTAPSPIAGNWAGLYPPPDKQYVYKSLDDGKTWQDAGSLPLDPSMIDGCSADDYVMFGQGAVDRDGTIYLGYRLCTQLAVAVSHDEGANWTTHAIPGSSLTPYNTNSLSGILSIVGHENAITGEPITLDPEGNLYAVWPDENNVLHYASSRDHGQHWSKPVWLQAPDVKEVRFAAAASPMPGTVAVAYFGSSDGIAFHGYIAESRNALEPEPTFWTATVNDPSDPLYAHGFFSGYDVGYFSDGGDGVEFVSVKYAPSGDIWAGFVKDMCGATPGTSCTWDYTQHAQSRFQGAAGRLVHAQP